ncbi:MAG: carbohydrate ABC transporter substrate-binding protein [Ruminococcus sp.]|nr:carbohydrate ABC transporter substrate-binding protein [Ruminococcus sp.]
MKVKKIILAAVTFIMIGVFSSCSEEKDNRKKITISWWGGESRHEATINAIKAFEEKNPDIKADVVFGAWDGWENSMTAAFYAGTHSDINQINTNWISEYGSEKELFLDLNSVSEHFDLSNYDKSSLEQCTLNGKLQAVPVSVTGRVFYWNKTTFEKAGLEIPSSLSELYNAGTVFRETLGDGYYPLVLGEYDRMVLMVYYLCSVYGEPWISDGKLNYTTAQIEEGMEFINSLEDGHVIPTIAEILGDGAVTFDKSPELISGKYAGIFEWDSASAKYARALEDGQELVAGDYFEDIGKYKGGFSKISVAFAISENTKYPEECARLLDFILNDPEGAVIMGTERGIPLSASARKACEGAGLLGGIEAMANSKVLEWSMFSLDVNFENPRLKVNPEGVYYDVFSGLSYGDYTTEEAAEMISDGFSDVLT